MLRNAGYFIGKGLEAVDGRIGEVRAFYFDDRRWTVRFLVVETGPWLDDRTVLVPHVALKQPAPGAAAIPVALTRGEVRDSPDIDCFKPVSRQQQAQLAQYYGWPQYWRWDSGRVYTREMAAAEATPAAGATAVAEGCSEEDPDLRSTLDVFGYSIQGIDGEVGTLRDFVVDDTLWDIRYLVVDTGSWFPGKKVLVPPAWVEKISWNDAAVGLGLSRRVVGSAPAWDPSVPYSEEYGEQLLRHYGTPPERPR